MTPEELIARTRELDALATKGPWEIERHFNCLRDRSQNILMDGSCAVGDELRAFLRDAELVAFYRTAAPALAVALEAERAKVKVAREALEAAWPFVMPGVSRGPSSQEWNEMVAKCVAANPSLDTENDAVQFALTQLDQ